jgi:hypothetical protein
LAKVLVLETKRGDGRGTEEVSLSQAVSNESSLREEIAGLFRHHRFTTYHVALVLTVYFISHLHPIADDDNRFAIGTCRHGAVALAVTGGTGHCLALGYRQGRGETQER